MATGGHSGGLTVLMVNNLPSYFTEDELKSTFSHFGELRSVRLARNKTTNKSLGYGFVEFTVAQNASKAIENVDGLQLGNKKMRVAYSQPLTEAEKNATKVCARKIPTKFTEDDVRDMFAKYGRIIKHRLLRDSVTNRSKTVAFVFFERWADATRAAAGLNGTIPEGYKQPMEVYVQEQPLEPKSFTPQGHGQSGPYSRPPSQSARGRGGHGQGGLSRGSHVQGGSSHQQHIPTFVSGSNSTSQVFLYNVGEYISEQEIYNIFAQFGGLLKIDIVRDPATKLCKGYAFLTFEHKASAENAIFTMDGMFYRGRQLQVRYKHG